jgi:H+/Cl- antiporter ClcA
VILSSVVGIVIGFLITIFLNLLHFAQSQQDNFGFSYYFLLPFGFVASVYLIKKFSSKEKTHGTDRIIESFHEHNGKMEFRYIPIKLLATIITIFSGGSAGKEGPGAQIGSSFSSWFSDFFNFSSQDRKKLAICGISAGFASVFGTPIAGAIFAVEILFVGVILYDVLLPSFIAGFAAFTVAQFLGVEYTFYDVKFYQDVALDLVLIFQVIVAGIFFGLVANLLVNIFKWGKEYFKYRFTNPYYQAFWGGLILIVLTLIFGESYLGLGLDLIKNSLDGNQDLPWYDFLLKSIFTSLTISAGGSGGIITPMFAIGSSSGHLFGELIGNNIALFAALGFVSVVAGATNAPLAGIIMAVELFGLDIAHYAALSVIIAFLLTGHKSIFPSQKLSMRKSEFLDVDVGGNINKASVHKNINLNEDLSRIKDVKLRVKYKKMLVRLRRRMVDDKSWW